jgi:hypothetical protein
VYDIIVDNLVKDSLEIYLLFSNATMKKLITSTTSASYGTAITNLVEDTNIYSIESFFSKKKAPGGTDSKDKGGAASSGASKKVSLWDYKTDIIIANRMLYM